MNIKRILTIITVLTGCVLVGVGLYQARWDYYYSIDELPAKGKAVDGKAVRVTGRIKENSWEKADQGQAYRFILVDGDDQLKVRYTGPDRQVPAGREVVLEGKPGSGDVFLADMIITRCGSKYTAGRKEHRTE